MTKSGMSKQYDLEERTLRFTKDAIKFINNVPRTLANKEIAKQVVRSSGSVGANYIEANEALSKKDFRMRIKICRKEAKETIYWLKLIEVDNEGADGKREMLIDESTQLKKIFSAIEEKSRYKFDFFGLYFEIWDLYVICNLEFKILGVEHVYLRYMGWT